MNYLFLVLFAVTNDSSLSNPASSAERSEADKLVDGMDFGELCNEFECISSPLVESTARQLVRDILELREGNRALGTYAVSVQYKVFIFFMNSISNSRFHGMLCLIANGNQNCRTQLEVLQAVKNTRDRYGLPIH